MAFTQKHLFSVSRPHQRGWIGGNQESTCRSPQKPPAKPSFTKRQFAKRVKQRWAFSSDTFPWTFHGQGLLVAFTPTYLRLLQCFHTFLSPSGCHPKPNAALKTLSNWSKNAYLACAARPPRRMFHRSATAKTGRVQRAVGTGRRGVAGIGGRKKPRPRKPEGHTRSDPG